MPEIAQNIRMPKLPSICSGAIKEMIYQKGTNLITDENELAFLSDYKTFSLPGNIENSLKVIDLLYDNFSTNIWISLMAQYTPIKI